MLGASKNHDHQFVLALIFYFFLISVKEAKMKSSKPLSWGFWWFREEEKEEKGEKK